MARDSKEHILETAFLLFMRKNFEAVTMNEIVKESGLSKGAFYHYFESKEKVFEEVINHFYGELFTQNFDSFSHESLEEFLKDYILDVNRKFLSVKSIGNFKETLHINHYLLIFDAIRILPAFRDIHRQNDLKEIKGWQKIIRIARKSGEIKTDLSDEQVAKMFLFIGDGIGMHTIFDYDPKKLPQLQKELKKLWYNFYSLLKA